MKVYGTTNRPALFEVSEIELVYKSKVKASGPKSWECACVVNNSRNKLNLVEIHLAF